jgi:hypothetical protein
MVGMPLTIDRNVARAPTGRVIFVIERRWLVSRLVPKIEMRRTCMRRVDLISDDPPREVEEFYLRDMTAIDLQTGSFLYEPSPDRGVNSND